MSSPPRLAIKIYLAILAAWLAFAFFVGPILVRQAYEGRSFSFVNKVISGRDVHPVEKYLRDWRKLALLGTGAIAVGLPGLYVAGNRVADYCQRPERHGMSRNGIYAALVVIGVYLGLSLVPIWKQRDAFPFCYYSMYSGVNREMRLEALQYYLVRADGTEELDWLAFPPFAAARLGPALQTQRNRGTLEEATRALVELRAQSDDQFRGLRVYQCVWELDDWATNVADPSRTLLCEVMRNDIR